MNRDLKGPLKTFALQISDVSRGETALGSLHPVRGQYFEGDKSFTPTRLFQIMFFNSGNLWVAPHTHIHGDLQLHDSENIKASIAQSV